jgi:hypothetical protein
MPTDPTIARIWRGRTRPEIADDYESYIKTEGIPPLEKTALGVQLSGKTVNMRAGSRPSPIGRTSTR